MVNPTDRGMTAIEETACILTDPERKGHTALYRATGEAPGSVTRQGECRENVGRSRYCGFHGKELERGDLHRRLGQSAEPLCAGGSWGLSSRLFGLCVTGTFAHENYCPRNWQPSPGRGSFSRG